MEKSLYERHRALRTLALIVSAHPYSARKFTCHFKHRARAQNTKLNNDRADDIVLVQFWFDLTILDVRWPLFFFLETDLIYNYPHIVQKWTKKSMWEVKIKFKISVHETWNPAISLLQGACNYDC